MALPANAVIEATMEGVLNGQKILSVFHYAVGTPSSTTTVSQEVTDFLNAWAQGGAGSFFTDYLACMPSNYSAQFAVAQAITPVRYVQQRIGKTGGGSQPDAQSSNLQASITLQTTLAGRPYVGGKRIPISQTIASDGIIGGATLSALNNFTVDILSLVTVPTGGGVYFPCIYHRPPSNLPPTLILRAFTQQTVRVMRRRTVGLGI